VRAADAGVAEVKTPTALFKAGLKEKREERWEANTLSGPRPKKCKKITTGMDQYGVETTLACEFRPHYLKMVGNSITSVLRSPN